VSNTAKAAEAVPHFIQRRVLPIVFASSSGHTEYVLDTLVGSLKSITRRKGIATAKRDQGLFEHLASRLGEI
jgi:hypothetical protein